MAETAGTAEPTGAESPITSDEIVASLGDVSSAPSAEPPTESVTPAPATEGSDASGSSVPESSAGPLPYERHKAILERARVEAREAAERDWKSRYGWAERYQPDQVEQSARLYQWLNQNPRGFMQWLSAQIGEGPAQAVARQVAQDEGPPQPDLRAEDGTPVYSAPQLQKFMEWKDRQYRAMVEPLQKKLEDREEKDKARQTAFVAKQSATGLLKYAREKWPAFTELEPDVLKAMQANPKLSFHDAYIRVFAESGTPKLREQWSAEYQGTLAQKQNATTTFPGKPAGTPKKFSEMDVRDVVGHAWDEVAKKR